MSAAATSALTSVLANDKELLNDRAEEATRMKDEFLGRLQQVFFESGIRCRDARFTVTLPLAPEPVAQAGEHVTLST